MDSPEYEQIGSFRFSKIRPVKDKEGLGFTWHFPAVTLALIVVLLASSKWAVTETERGNFLPSRIVSIGVLASLYVVPLIILVVQRVKRPKRRLDKVVPPANYPQSALRCVARISSQDKARLKSLGWLWVEGDLLTFRGGLFDFALRYRDFHKQVDLKKLAGGKNVRMLTPKGVPPRQLALFIGGTRDGVEYMDPSGAEVLAPLLEEWRRAAISSEPSLFPPIRRTGNYKLSPKLWLGTAIAAVLFALFGLAFTLIFKDYLPKDNPAVLMCALALFPLAFPLLVVSCNAEIDRYNKSIDKVKGTGRVEMV